MQRVSCLPMKAVVALGRQSCVTWCTSSKLRHLFSLFFRRIMALLLHILINLPEGYERGRFVKSPFFICKAMCKKNHLTK
jgi:hypothetical protein